MAIKCVSCLPGFVSQAHIKEGYNIPMSRPQIKSLDLEPNHKLILNPIVHETRENNNNMHENKAINCISAIFNVDQ